MVVGFADHSLLSKKVYFKMIIIYKWLYFTGRAKVIEKDIQGVMDGVKMFEDLVLEGKIEYLDVNEEGDSMIAVYEDSIQWESTDNYKEAQRLHLESTNTTHLEIAPFTLLGAV